MTKRVNLSLPDRLYDELQAWADYEGRPATNLCNFLIEAAIREEKRRNAPWSKVSGSQIDRKAG